MKRLSLWFVFVCGIFFNSQAQNSKYVDSLIGALNFVKSDSLYLHTLVEICNRTVYSAPAVSKEYGDLLLKKALEKKHNYFIALAYKNKGNGYFLNSNYSEAMAEYLKALERFEKLNLDKEKAGLYHNIGNIMLRLGKADQAIAYMSKAEQINRSVKNNSWLVNNITGIGVVYMDLKNDYKSALPYFNEGIEIAQTSKNAQMYILSALNLGTCNFELKNYNTAREWILKALVWQDSTGERRFEEQCFEKAGIIEMQLMNFEKAELYFNKSLEHALKTRKNDRIVSIYRNLGEVYEKQGKHQLAYENLRYSRRYSDSVFNDNEVRKIADLETKYQIEKKEQEKSLLGKVKDEEIKRNQIESFYLLDKKEQEKILLSKVKDEEIKRNNLEAKFQLEKKEQEKILLEKVKDEEIKRIRNARIFWTSLSVLILVLLLVSALAYRSKQKNLSLLAQKNKEISEKNDILNLLNEEKTNILHIVSHDFRGPLGKIQAAAELIGLNSETLTESQQKNLKKIPNIVKEADHLISDLLEAARGSTNFETNSNQAVSLKSFSDTLKLRFEKLAADKNIDLVIVCDEEKTFSIDEDKVNRILDNLVSNAIKYSPENTSVVCRIVIDNSRLHILVKDEGQGFSENDKLGVFKKFSRLSAAPIGNGSSYGLGLSIVKKLVDELKGEIRLKSSKGNGSSFYIQI